MMRPNSRLDRYSWSPDSTSTRVTSASEMRSIELFTEPPFRTIWPVTVPPGTTEGFWTCVSIEGPPTPNVLSIFLNTRNLP
jgi:hypothetical protein